MSSSNRLAATSKSHYDWEEAAGLLADDIKLLSYAYVSQFGLSRVILLKIFLSELICTFVFAVIMKKISCLCQK